MNGAPQHLTEQPVFVAEVVWQPAPPAQPATPSADRRGLRWRLVLVAAIVLAVLVPTSAVAFVAAHRHAVDGAASTGGMVPPPREERLVRAALDRQSTALLAGDLAGFLAPVQESEFVLRAELTRRFNALRAMRVARWNATADGEARATGAGVWALPVRLEYCFAVPDCEAVSTVVESRWLARDGAMWLTEFGKDTRIGPQPWEVADLRVAAGNRVVLAAPAHLEQRLPALLAVAERAAGLTDTYAKWTRPPSRYIIYLAGPEEWLTWFEGAGGTAAGFALPLDDDARVVVLHANRLGPEPVDLLRHELAHVATLIGVRRHVSWWLTEGIAEYVEALGRGGEYTRLRDVRDLVRSGRWAGDATPTGAPSGVSQEDLSGYYGMAYLAVRRLVERFGEEKMLAFFDAVARRGRLEVTAAPEVLGVPWEAVHADCVQYVRNRAK